MPVEGGTEWATVRGFVSRPDRPRPPRPQPAALRQRARGAGPGALEGGAGGVPRGGRGGARLRGVPVRRAAAAPRGRERAPGEDRGAVRRRRARSAPPSSGRCATALSAGVREAPRSRARGVGRAPRRARGRRRRRSSRAASGRSRGRSGPAPGAGASLAAEGAARAAARRRPRPSCWASTGSSTSSRATARSCCSSTSTPRTSGSASSSSSTRAGRRLVESQGLLAPAGRRARPRACGRCSTRTSEALRELGYDVEPFGGGATRLRAVPAILGTRDPGPALERDARGPRGARRGRLGGGGNARPAGGDARVPLRGAGRPAAGRRADERRSCATSSAPRTRRSARTAGRRSCASRARSSAAGSGGRDGGGSECRLAAMGGRVGVEGVHHAAGVAGPAGRRRSGRRPPAAPARPRAWCWS